jgi:two-component system, OmpR family, KDP operon response regulator KdpE
MRVPSLRARSAIVLGLLMDTWTFRRRTTVLVLTADVGLVRLARSILEPVCRVIGKAPSSREADMHGEQADVVIVDAQSIDIGVILTATRSWPDAKVIALSHEFREADCVAILDADADYLPRPFRAEDLAARVRVAELRRFNATGRPRLYRNGPLVFDLFVGALTIDGRTIALAPSEVALFSVLAAEPGVVAQYDRIFAEVKLGGSQRTRQALRSCVFGLRRKIERDSLHPEILLAEAGVGYRLAAAIEDPTHRARDSLPADQERDGPP